MSIATEFIEETAKLTFEVSTIPEGEYILFIQYEGQISSTKHSGFYKCVDPRIPQSIPLFYMVDTKCPEELIANTVLTTTFEPIFAREAFPCFDEPDKKAIFQVIISLKR